jgi:hypothetical protein
MAHRNDGDWNDPQVRAAFQFYGDLGYALTQWANVEKAIFGVFSFAFQHPSPESAMAVFAAAQFHGKVKMTTVALQIFPAPPDLLARWKRLGEDAKQLAIKRNWLAHWVMSRETGADGIDVYKLHPASGTFESPGALGTQDLQPIAREFNVLSMHITGLRSALAAQP